MGRGMPIVAVFRLRQLQQFGLEVVELLVGKLVSDTAHVFSLRPSFIEDSISQKRLPVKGKIKIKKLRFCKEIRILFPFFGKIFLCGAQFFYKTAQHCY